MGRRLQREVVREQDIVDDYAPPRKKRARTYGGWANRVARGEEQERRPANPWVPPGSDDWPPLAAVYEELPRYSLDAIQSRIVL